MKGHFTMRRIHAALIAALAAALLAATTGPVAGAATPAASQQGEVVQQVDDAAAVNEAVGLVERAYKTVLGRLPDAEGLDYWLGRMAAGMSYDDLLAFFLGSPERAEKYPDDQTDGDFLDQLYEDAFGRAPDGDGRDYWVGRLEAGLPRIEVVKLFADSPEQRTQTEADVAFAMNILHINDHHSHLQSDSADINVGGDSTRVELGGFSRVIAKMDELEGGYADGTNVARVHAGDAITGTIFFSLFDGEADAAMMNQACFDVFALGNHEFDSGDEGLKTFLDFLDDDTDDCTTEVLAANVVPQVGTPLAPNSPTDYIEPFHVMDFPDGQVGFIGIDIANKTQNSSSPLDTTQFLDEVETTQRYVDELTAAGVDKIVLVSHYQYDNDLELASMVSGVDVIVGGDSHTLLGDFEDVGLTSGGAYPTPTTDKNGVPVCVVQAWQYSAVVGELMIEWDQYGHVASCGGTPHLLLGDSFMRRPADGGDRVDLEGDDLAAVLADIEANPSLSVVMPDADAEAVLEDYSEEADALAAVAIGEASENLCLERIPNQGRSTIDGCQELTATTGGMIQQLVADAFRDRSFEADIALQNAGGVRIDILAGEISIADAYELLPFANTLVNLEMTGQQIDDSLEEGIQNAVREDGSTGAYPYASGLRFDVDLTQEQGERVTNIEYQAKDSTEWVPLDPAASYTVVTNDFMASGGDGYDTMGEIFGAGDFTDTFLDYAKSFIDFVEAQPVGDGGLPVLDRPTVYSTNSFIGLPEDG